MMEREYNNLDKIYVEVAAVFSKDGQILPTSFVFENGNTYKIDRIIQIDRRASLKAGGIGIAVHI